MPIGRVTGTYERTEVLGTDIYAFVPAPLPPREPPLELEPATLELARHAQSALQRLDLAAEMVPSVDWFLYGFVCKEAVLSSQIEGTQATLVDLFAFEASPGADGAPDPDVEEVCNYVDALTYGRAEMRRTGGLPLSIRLINQMHLRLMRGSRGGDKSPGEVRRLQNWIGAMRPDQASFVPPPPWRLPDLLGELERYVHLDDGLPPLVRAALVHVQFETIHPYLDGNGRIGRLLVTLLFDHWRLLEQPLLYLSLFFKRRRADYYRLLNAVRHDGDWESWVRFFLDGVDTTATEAVGTARDLFARVAADRQVVLATPSASLVAARLFEQLPRHPIVTVASTTRLLDTTKPTATKAISALVDAGVLAETTGKKRDRTFRYGGYLDLLRRGTELG